MAEDIFYLLEVGKDAGVRAQVAEALALAAAPGFVRLSVNKPVNTWGWPANAKGSLLGLGKYGVAVGTLDDAKAPRILIPWHDVSYLADGTLLAEQQKAPAAAQAGGTPRQWVMPTGPG